MKETVTLCEDLFDTKLPRYSKLIVQKEIIIPDAPSDQPLHSKSSEKEIEERLVKLKIFNKVWFGEDSSYNPPVKPLPSVVQPNDPKPLLTMKPQFQSSPMK